MKVKIVRIKKGVEAVPVPEDLLRRLGLAPGNEVEIVLDRKKNWLVIRPMHGDEFLEHFKDSMETMA